jgi:nucleotide-binding universal stress UspA family protein
MLILAALDRSERDRLVVEQVRRLAGQPGATARLLHVVSLPKSVVPGAAREADAYLQAVQAGLEAAGIAVTSQVIKGDVPDEIVKAASEHEADLVVLGTRGRRGWDKLALGSVAEAVLEHCAQPVLVVNEATIHEKLDDEIRRKSSYIASVIWSKQARGEITAQQAEIDIARLAERGLSRSIMIASYNALAADGLPPDWLDIKFQIATLAEYLPSEVAWLPLGQGAEEAA